MLRISSLVMGIVWVCVCHAQEAVPQELVPNGGFESLSKEPSTFDQLPCASGWANVTLGYSEVFSSTALARTVGIPVNDYGTMLPQEGEHYAGFCAWKDDVRGNLGGSPDDPFKPGWSVYSEYIIGQLSAPLVAGRTYACSFWIALSGNSDRAVAGLGAFFSTTPLRYTHRRFLQQRPQISADGIQENRSTWVEIKGQFVADGEERFIVIGTFPTAEFDSKKLVEGPDNQYAYYYIDHVVLKEMP